MGSWPLKKPGRPSGVGAGELICLPGGESGRAGAWEWQGRLGLLGCETGVRSLPSFSVAAFTQGPFSQPAGTHGTWGGGAVAAGFRALCWLWLAELLVALGHLRSSCGDSFLCDFS